MLYIPYMNKQNFILVVTTLTMLSESVFSSPVVNEFQLTNGMKILVQEDHRVPVVVSQIWYKVGSSYEPSGMSGISHVLEHMMFKGTETVGPGEFARIIAANGGTQNAFTSRDYTAYFQSLQKDRLEVSFRLEADRMDRLLLTENEVEKELRVVAEERRLRTDDSPEGLTYEQFYATAYITSPYRNPIIGWMHDLNSLNVTKLQDWYQKWYVPNNAVLVVVGDVHTQKVFKLAESHFGSLKARALPKRKFQPEIPQLGERRVNIRVPAELPFIVLGYKVPVLKTAQNKNDPYVLQVLAGILDAGSSARLSRNLIRGKQLAAKAYASYNMMSLLDELFVLAANPVPGYSPTQVEQALRAEVKRLREELVNAEELARVVAQVVATEVYELDSLFYQAMRIGVLESTGLGWNVLEDYVERIQAITPEQIRNIARTYLIDDHLTVATLEPLPLKEKSTHLSSEKTRKTLH